MEVTGSRRPTLSQHMSVLDSSSLRDLLRARDGDDGRHTLAGLTLAAVLGGENRRAPTRTLLDIIREEESGAAYRGLIPRHHQNKKSWKSFKERLRIRREGLAWPSSSSSSRPVSIENCEIQISTPFSAIRNTRSPTQISPTITGADVGAAIPVVIPTEFRPEPEPVVMRLSAALEAERESHVDVGPSSAAVVEEGEVVPPPPAVAEGTRVSLMSLLEETDGRREAALVVGEEERENDDVAGGGGGGGGGGRGVQEYVCCVCMVRHKGAAFIPCGHTFCRLCSRELWVSRGNCPLCNGYILEILDIF